MVSCPRGHSSSATDYCDECGAPIGGGTPGAAAAVPAASPVAAPLAASGGGAPCPECDTPRSGRFCEVCGHDFLAEPASSATAVPEAGSSAAASTPAEVPDAAATASGAVGSGTGPAQVPATGWRVVVSADREYFERMRTAWGPDADQVEFPPYCPQRVFELTGQQLLIGRRSRSRGVAPEIDLTGPPEDVGVSHTHALLVGNPDGTWSVVDLDSANGTYLNAETGQLAAHTPTPLHGGDTVHVGAWTTLTVYAS